MQTLWQNLRYGARRWFKKLCGVLIVLLAVALWHAPGDLHAQETTASNWGLPASDSRLFDFHSGLWVNLHHFLYVQARARLRTPDSRRRAVADISAELERLDKLPLEERRIWEAAIAYYEKELAAQDLIFDDRLIAVTNTLAAQESAPTVSASKLTPALIGVLEACAPVYRAQWWPRHNRANQNWVAKINPLLKKYEASVARQLTAAYHTDWPKHPFRVDVCAYANWAGAYTTDDPARITLSSTDVGNSGTQGLETLFHESLHALEAPLVAALRQQAEAQGKRLPRLLSHAIIFYTAGEIVRRTVPAHTPYAVANKIWDNAPWTEHRRLLDQTWQPHLAGKSDFNATLKQMVAAL